MKHVPIVHFTRTGAASLVRTETAVKPRVWACTSKPLPACSTSCAETPRAPHQVTGTKPPQLIGCVWETGGIRWSNHSKIQAEDVGSTFLGGFQSFVVATSKVTNMICQPLGVDSWLSDARKATMFYDSSFSNATIPPRIARVYRERNT